MKIFNEAKLEKAIIAHIREQGIEHVHGAKINRSLDDVLIKDDLKTYLQKKYKSKKITTGEIDGMIKKLERFSSADLFESNKSIMKMVREG